MRKLFYFLLVLFSAGCKEKYELPAISPVTGYLVVEGVISPGPEPTVIELSRTSKTDATQKQFEQGATVQVEGDDNSTQLLSEISAGNYSATLALNSSRKYRLKINTAGGKEYLSAFVEVKTTPAIDSVSWQRESNGVTLQMNTHDPQNNTRYYRWDYKETWEFHSPYRKYLIYTSSTSIGYWDLISGLSDTSIFKCWRSANSNNILLGSSAKLSDDVIYKEPFLFIPAGDRKLSVLYSIYVRQYALTKEAYEFLEKMKKNTEGTGSIFDPQPSQLNGNITCVTDPAEAVIGFVSVSTVTDKRIFIRNNEVPGWNFINSCTEGKVRNDPDSIDVASGAGLVPTDVLETNGFAIVYFGVTSRGCLDCTLSGTNVRPPFWP